MAGEPILIDLTYKSEVKTRPYILEQLLFYYSSPCEKLTLCQFLHGLILGGFQSFL